MLKTQTRAETDSFVVENNSGWQCYRSVFCLHYEQVSDWVSESVSDWASERLCELASDWTSELINEWVDWMSELINEWVSGLNEWAD